MRSVVDYVLLNDDINEVIQQDLEIFNEISEK
jgi:hypothetical protein